MLRLHSQYAGKYIATEETWAELNESMKGILEEARYMRVKRERALGHEGSDTIDTFQERTGYIVVGASPLVLSPLCITSSFLCR
jgi:hypothetical protein